MKTVDELVEFYSTKNFTGDLTIRRNSDTAVLHFESGLLLSTKLNGAFNDSNYYTLLEWEAGSFQFNAGEKSEEKKNLNTDEKQGKTKENKKIMEQTDISKAVKIANDTYWVGYRNPDTMLQINVYLRIFRGNGKQINMLIDPWFTSRL